MALPHSIADFRWRMGSAKNSIFGYPRRNAALTQPVPLAMRIFYSKTPNRLRHLGVLRWPMIENRFTNDSAKRSPSTSRPGDSQVWNGYLSLRRQRRPIRVAPQPGRNIRANRRARRHPYRSALSPIERSRQAQNHPQVRSPFLHVRFPPDLHSKRPTNHNRQGTSRRRYSISRSNHQHAHRKRKPGCWTS